MNKNPHFYQNTASYDLKKLNEISKVIIINNIDELEELLSENESIFDNGACLSLMFLFFIF